MKARGILPMEKKELKEKIEKLKIDFDDIETSVKLIMDIINCLN